VKARVRLGSLARDEVAVELYLGRIDARDELQDDSSIPMQFSCANPDGSCTRLERRNPAIADTVLRIWYT